MDIKENSEQSNGLVMLQEQLLSNILVAKSFKINHAQRGMNVIKERFCNKRVLIVINDVSTETTRCVGG